MNKVYNTPLLLPKILHHHCLHVVARSLKLVKLLSQQLSTFLLFHDRRSVLNATMLGPCTRITYVLHGDSKVLTC